MTECGATTVINGRTHTCRRMHVVRSTNPTHRCACNETWGGWAVRRSDVSVSEPSKDLDLSGPSEEAP